MRHTKYDIRHTKDEPRVTSHESRTKHGVTLVEILIVVAIIAILATMVISLAARIDSQGKERLTESTFALLNAALGEFCDYGYNYEAPYSEFDFPLDCNGFGATKLEDTLEVALGAGIVEIIGIDENGVEHVNVDFRIEDSGCEALCFFLNRVSESRKTLAKIDRKTSKKIDSSLMTNEGTSGNGDIEIKRIIRIDGRDYPLLRIIDPWGETLRYDYYDEDDPKPDEARTFPVIISAGPDGIFGTDDDIASR